MLLVHAFDDQLLCTITPEYSSCAAALVFVPHDRRPALGDARPQRSASLRKMRRNHIIADTTQAFPRAVPIPVCISPVFLVLSGARRVLSLSFCRQRLSSQSRAPSGFNFMCFFLFSDSATAVVFTLEPCLPASLGTYARMSCFCFIYW